MTSALKLSVFSIALCVSASAAFSKGYSPAVTARPGGYEVKFSPSGQPIAVPASGGAVARAEAAFKFQWPNGVDATAAAISIFTGAKTAGAFGAASAAVGVAAMFAIPAIKAWMETAALAPMNGGGIGSKPAGADNFDYTTDGGYSWQSTAMGSCQALADRSNNPSSGPWVKRVPTSYIYDGYGSGGMCKGNTIYQNYPSTAYDSYNVNLGGTDRRVKQLPVDPVPVSMADAIALLGAASPSAAVVQALVDINFPPEAEPPKITGEVSSYKGNTVQLGLDGTVTEINERYIASFSPGIIGIGVETTQKVTTPAKTQSVVTTNADGSQSTAIITTPASSSTITNSSSVATPSASDSPAIDSPMPVVPKLYEPVYPRGFAGVWSDKKAQLSSAPLSGLMSSLMPAVASVGSCPSMPVNLNFSTWANFGVKDVAPPCYIWDWGKAVIILSALLLARGLIFGG